MLLKWIFNYFKKLWLVRWSGWYSSVIYTSTIMSHDIAISPDQFFQHSPFSVFLGKSVLVFTLWASTGSDCQTSELLPLPFLPARPDTLVDNSLINTSMENHKTANIYDVTLWSPSLHILDPSSQPFSPSTDHSFVDITQAFVFDCSSGLAHAVGVGCLPVVPPQSSCVEPSVYPISCLVDNKRECYFSRFMFRCNFRDFQSLIVLLNQSSQLLT